MVVSTVSPRYELLSSFCAKILRFEHFKKLYKFNSEFSIIFSVHFVYFLFKINSFDLVVVLNKKGMQILGLQFQFVEHCLDKSVQTLVDNHLHAINSNLSCCVRMLHDFQPFTFVQINLDNFVRLVNFFYEFRISSKVTFQVFKICASQDKFLLWHDNVFDFVLFRHATQIFVSYLVFEKPKLCDLGQILFKNEIVSILPQNTLTKIFIYGQINSNLCQNRCFLAISQIVLILSKLNDFLFWRADLFNCFDDYFVKLCCVCNSAGLQGLYSANLVSYLTNPCFFLSRFRFEDESFRGERE
ncbi:hypothetical protein ACH5RR_039162 [Cinchona calisaya]|uniref:Maturase K n=1 Tax=Cinchona calisaya TaxID=153742 RepID=A0ABD2XXH5_9GENT